MGNDTRKKIRDVSDKCSRDLNKFFSDYNADNGMLPPTAILITKYDKCKNDTTPKEIEEIIRDSFKSFLKNVNLTSKNILSIIPVSIGLNIDDIDYSGNLEPINIYLPIFWGIYFVLDKKIKELKKNIDSNNDKIKNLDKQISERKKERDDEADSFFLWRDDKKINSLTSTINFLEKTKNETAMTINKINTQLVVSKEYIQRLRKELKKIPLVFIDGEKRENFF